MTGLPDTDGKNLVEMLDMLKPIPEPAPVSMFPATAGWIWLSLAVLALSAWLLWRGYRRWRTNAYRRAALADLDGAGDDPAAIAAILRRAALAAYPRAEVASLTGAEWIAFLDRTSGGDGFAGGPGDRLVRAPYRAEPADPDLARLARRWIKRHRAGATP